MTACSRRQTREKEQIPEMTHRVSVFRRTQNLTTNQDGAGAR
jgi:hypothetical protein